MPQSLMALLPVLLVGLAGSIHCVGMCGGIVGALSAAAPPAAPVGQARVIPIRAAASTRSAASALRVLAYNAGRLGSYMAAGALAGGLAGGAVRLTQLAALQVGLYWLANLMLVALGLYLMEAWRGLLMLEAAGQRAWRAMLPVCKRLLPMDSVPKALALGALWGWLPCGMVYSVLLTALMSGSAASGAAVMAAFGLGTLPLLFGLGMAGASLRRYAQQPVVRRACGVLVLGFGMLGLVRASLGVSFGWLDALCLTVH